jgi:hypothetical protein
MSDANQQLQQAYRLIKTNHKAEARAILSRVIKADPTVVDAYWLWSLAAESADQARKALEKMLTISPGHERAQQALAKLNAHQEQSTLKPKPPIAVESAKPGSHARTTGRSRQSRPISAANDKTLNNKAIIIFAVIGILVVVFIAVVLIVGMIQRGDSGDQAETAGQEEAGGAESALANCPDGVVIPEEAIQNDVGIPIAVRGCIERNGQVRETISLFMYPAWAFYGTAGETYTIGARQFGQLVYVELYLYGPQGTLLTKTDPITDLFSGRDHSYLTVKLTGDGTYTIVVGLIELDVPYELTLR